MFSKKNRLPKTEFKKVFKMGNRIHTPYFVLLHLRNPEVKSPQIGIIASTKVGKATKRNKAKRRIREVFKSQIPKLHPNIQIIAISKPTITSLPYKQLQKEILSALKKNKLYID